MIATKAAKPVGAATKVAKAIGGYEDSGGIMCDRCSVGGGR